MVVFVILSGSLTGISSQAADNVLRPLIGEKNTLAMESVFFGFEDKLNFLHYLLFKQNAPTYGSAIKSKPISPVKLANTQDQQMNLLPIAAPASLPPLSGEGQWVNIDQSLYPKQVILARNFIRPDTTHPYAVVSFVQMDMTKLGIGAQAGTYYPGGTHGVDGPGVIPQQVQASNNLLAAFNGGFQEMDGHYGMIVGNTTYVPLRVGLPTLVMSKGGGIKFEDYTGQSFATSPDFLAARQNGPYLVHNGQIVSADIEGTDTWGRTITNDMYTWRSGLGITKQGNLIYAVGNSLLPSTLAAALKSAGAVNAVQLDINPPWVRYIIYQTLGSGKYTPTPLLSDMVGGQAYIQGYNKDFFYVYKK